MKKIIKKIINLLFNNNEKKDLFLRRVFYAFNRDPLIFAYNNIGILNYKTNRDSGEDYFIEDFLPKFLNKRNNHVFFDVGANVGEYSLTLSKNFTKANIYSFEPNINTFNVLKKNVGSTSSITPTNIGMSDYKKDTKIYTYTTDSISGHASMYKEVFSSMHKRSNLQSVDIKLETIDDFCLENKIEIIDFLKIDTEGHELDVLKGAKNMLNQGNIKIIQFEFNEMNVISKVFLKDFYNILKSYKLYRLDTSKLIPLFEYNSINEIFKFQNFIAIHKSA